MKKNLLKIGALACGLGLGSFSTANASLMTLNDGAGHTVSLNDAGTLVVSAGVTTTFTSVAPAGTVQWQGNFGLWSLSVNLGITKPFQGNAVAPFMDLQFAGTSTGAANLTISWSDSGFGPSSGGFADSIGGTLAASGGSVGFATFYSLANTVPAATPLNTGLAFAVPGGFSGGNVASVGALPSPYSLTETVTLHHNGSGVTSGDAQLQAVADGGNTLFLMGAVLAVIGCVSRLERTAAQKKAASVL